MSTTALLVFRGLGAGLAWTIAVDAYILASVKESTWTQKSVTRGGSCKTRNAFKLLSSLCKRNMLGFASFLGIFAGVSCSLEKAREKNDVLNEFAGGFTAGLVCMLRELRDPRALLTSAFVCGSASMALHFFIPAVDKNETRTR
ncbi:hypothetical protein CCR75_008260 [Bremia lactucae]|uniref:Mitochondrial import inner membrane translocase subunit TIM22 n=1 Tax=Bremia lactucae TaxID=4779 RepID=A0A976ILC9_BRELC|nr:hypothetical protein CCR75_008260 [Bremia lactucae]